MLLFQLADQVKNGKEENEMNRKIRAVRKELKEAKKESSLIRKTQKQELQRLNRKLWTKRSELCKRGRSAQRHYSMYDYAIFMRISRYNQRSGGSGLSMSSQKLQFLLTDICDRKPDGSTEGPVVLRSQTVYGSSRFLWQLFVASMLEVRLLKLFHVLLMLHTQNDLHKKGYNKMTMYLYKQMSSEKLDKRFVESSNIVNQIETIKSSTKDMEDAHKKRLAVQRKLIYRLKLKIGQQISKRSLKKIRRWTSESASESEQEISSRSTKELQQGHFKGSRTHSQGPSILENKQDLKYKDKDKDNCHKKPPKMISASNQILFDISPIMSKELKQLDTGYDRKNLDEQDSIKSAASLPEYTRKKGRRKSRSKNRRRLKSGISDDDEDSAHSMPTMSVSKSKTPRTTKKRPRTPGFQREMAASNANERNRGIMQSLGSSHGHSRAELLARRKRAEERLALSKQRSIRSRLLMKQLRAEERLNVSKRKLQEFLSSEDDECNHSRNYNEEEGSNKSPSSVFGYPDFLRK
jgi:hypothetical protein